MKKNNPSPLYDIKSLDNRDYWRQRMYINQIDKAVRKLSKAIKRKKYEIQQAENAEKAKKVKGLRKP